jgi:Outer membrane protein beta-barrel domain
MNKILLPLLLIVSFSAFAQRKFNANMDDERFFRFGFKGGINVNKISGLSYNAGFNYNYQLGGFIQFNFANRFGIQPEINFVQTSSEFSNDPSDIYDDIFRDGSQKTSKLNYLEIPVLFNINIGSSKKLKLQLGPSYGGLLKQTVDSLKNNAASIYKKAEWSGIGGIWFQLPAVNFGARYKMGFTNINAIDNKETWKNQAIQVFVGITF